MLTNVSERSTTEADGSHRAPYDPHPRPHPHPQYLLRESETHMRAEIDTETLQLIE